MVYLWLSFSFFWNLHLLFFFWRHQFLIWDTVNQRFCFLQREEALLGSWDHMNENIMWTYCLKLVLYPLKYNFNSREPRQLSKLGSSSTLLFFSVVVLTFVWYSSLFKESGDLGTMTGGNSISPYHVPFWPSLELALASTQPGPGRESFLLACVASSCWFFSRKSV